MASINTKTAVEPIRTAGGAVASRITPLQELERLTMCCLLWENLAYTNGMTTAKAIQTLVHTVTLEEAANVAIKAREEMHLRHVPLLIVREMARHPKLAQSPRIVSETLNRVIQRPDELNEFLAIYWKEGKQPISKQVKLGLAMAFSKFPAYSLAKYDRKKDITLKDVLFLCHAKPADVSSKSLPWNKQARKSAKDNTQVVDEMRPQGFTKGEVVFQQLIDGTLPTPDTWEVRLSAGKDKAETFKQLMMDFSLGDMAFLKNLRNMVESGVDPQLIKDYGHTRRWERVLPFRFLSAAKHNPSLEHLLEQWMMKGLLRYPKLKGSTLLVVDISGSMYANLSSKSELTRLEAAAALTILAREVCEDPIIYLTAGDDYHRVHATSLIPARKGFALADYITKGDGNEKLGSGGIFLAQCMNFINAEQKQRVFDRVMVFTDEQDIDTKLNPKDAQLLGKQNYLVNISSEKNGIGYEKWTHINGFSETVLDFIIANEAQQ